MARSKYKLRSDGRREGTKCYNGKIKHFYGKSDAEIDNKILEYEESLKRTQISPFKDVAESYWNDKQKDLSINTLHGYDVAVRRSVEEFNDTPIADITPTDIYNFLDKFKAQGYSQKVISNTKSVLRGIFDYAFIKGKVTSNPCTGIPIVKGKKKVPRKSAESSDIEKIENAKTDSLTALMMYFILYTGARIGEAAALQVKDIDYKNHIAYVHQTLAYGNGSAPNIKPTPKTDSSIRTLAIPQKVMDLLPTYRNKDTFIFFPEGLPRRRAFDTAIAKYREKFGISATPHQLRHSYASMLHSAGIDVKDAQSLLGHSSISMTQDIYTHLEKEHRERVLKRIDDYTSSNTSSET